MKEIEEEILRPVKLESNNSGNVIETNRITIAFAATSTPNANEDRKKSIRIEEKYTRFYDCHILV